MEFNTLYGEKIILPKERAVFRPSGYAIIIKNRKILLVKMKLTGKYFFPGGGAEIDETVEDAVKREVKEEVGVDVAVKDLLHFEENLFYYDPTGEAWHALLLFFYCSTDQEVSMDHTQSHDDEGIEPAWVSIDSLTENDFQDAGKNVFKKIRSRF